MQESINKQAGMAEYMSSTATKAGLGIGKGLFWAGKIAVKHPIKTLGATALALPLLGALAMAPKRLRRSTKDYDQVQRPNMPDSTPGF